MSVGLVVNCYERTYRNTLRPGFFPMIAASNRHEFEERVALINNVTDPADATRRAGALLEAGEITSFAFVADYIDHGLAAARLPRRALGRRPYLLDYGLVMPHVIAADWLLGWDAEVTLHEPADWISSAIGLMEHDPRVMTASLNWQTRGDWDGGLAAETVEVSAQFGLSRHECGSSGDRFVG